MWGMTCNKGLQLKILQLIVGTLNPMPVGRPSLACFRMNVGTNGVVFVKVRPEGYFLLKQAVK